MSSINFSFGNAVSHFQKTGGPSGFLWKFGLAYGLASLVVQVISFWFMGPMYAVMFNPALANDPYAMEEAMMNSLGQIMIGYLLMLVLGVLLWMMFESASQRRYMRAEGFSLKLGADEWRILMVGLIWFAIFIGLYLAGIIIIAVPTGIIAAVTESPALTGLLVFILAIAYFVFALWLIARFSPASALTIRDRSIQFGKAWSVTRGKGWTILGSWFVLMLLWMVLLFIFYIAFIFVVVAAVMSAGDPTTMDDPEMMMRAILSPGVIIPGVIFMLGYMFLAAIMMHVIAGPAALGRADGPLLCGRDDRDVQLG